MADYKIKIGADSSNFKAALEDVTKRAESAGSKFKDKLFGAVASTAAVAGLTQMIKNSVEAGTQISRQAERLRLTTDEYQRLSAMAERAGSTIESTVPAFIQMNRVIYEASQGSMAAVDIIEELNISIEDLRNADAIQQFEIVAKALSQVANESDKSALSARIWGESGTELIPLLNNFQGLKEIVEDTLVLMDKEAISASRKFSDEIEMIRNNMQAAFVNSGLLKYLDDIAGSMNDIIVAAKAIESGTSVDSRTPGLQGPGATAMAVQGIAKVAARSLVDVVGSVLGLAFFSGSAGLEGAKSLFTFADDEPPMHTIDTSDPTTETTPEKITPATPKSSAPKKNIIRRTRDKFEQGADAIVDFAFDKSHPIGATAATEAEISAARKRMEREQQLKKNQEQRKKNSEKESFLADRAVIESELDEEFLADMAEKNKAESFRKMGEEKYKDLLEDLKHQTRLQKLSNEGLDKEAAIEEAIYQARKRNAYLTEKQLDEVGEMAGLLYDLQNTKLPTADIREMGTPDYGREATSLERMGAMLGPRSTSDEARMLQRKIESTMRQQLRILNNINKQNRLAELGYA